MNKDINGHFFYMAYYKWVGFKAVFYTQINKVGCYLKGIKLGIGCKFYGYCLMVRHPYSRIQIGAKCKFRSSSDSNLIGISKQCILSTHSIHAQILIGNGCGFSGTSISAKTTIIIGNNGIFGSNTLITDFDWHNIHPLKRHLPVEDGKPITIEDNVFLGYSVTVLKGVSIGKNSVIGAHSVVTSNIPPDSLAAGNPCKVIAQIKF